MKLKVLLMDLQSPRTPLTQKKLRLSVPAKKTHHSSEARLSSAHLAAQTDFRCQGIRVLFWGVSVIETVLAN